MEAEEVCIRKRQMGSSDLCKGKTIRRIQQRNFKEDPTKLKDESLS